MAAHLDQPRYRFVLRGNNGEADAKIQFALLQLIIILLPRIIEILELEGECIYACRILKSAENSWGRGGSGLDFSGTGRVVTFGLGLFWAFQFKNWAWGFQNLCYYNSPENL
jgi:hypothetical protein